MICSARELGLGDDHDGHHRAARPTPGSPATTPSSCCSLRDEVIEFEINPDRAYALSLRGVAREAALAIGDLSAFHDPADRDAAGAERRRLPGARSRTRSAARSSRPAP